MLNIQSKVSGGKKFRKAVKETLKATGAKRVDVGFFETAKYPDQTPVAAVAVANEFGAGEGKPERPFFRNALANIENDVARAFRNGVDPQTLKVKHSLLERVGAMVQGAVQQEITDLRKPPNAQSTIDRKGSSNPLIDEGVMRTAVTYEVGNAEAR